MHPWPRHSQQVCSSHANRPFTRNYAWTGVKSKETLIARSRQARVHIASCHVQTKHTREWGAVVGARRHGAGRLTCRGCPCCAPVRLLARPWCTIVTKEPVRILGVLGLCLGASGQSPSDPASVLSCSPCQREVRAGAAQILFRLIQYVRRVTSRPDSSQEVSYTSCSSYYSST